MKDFLRRFGQRRRNGTFYFSNVRSGLIVALLSIGTLFGALIAAPIADFIGRKNSIIVWCGIFSIGIIVQIAATDKWYEIMMGRFVAGLGVGALSLLVPMYQVCIPAVFCGWKGRFNGCTGRNRSSPYSRCAHLNVPADDYFWNFPRCRFQLCG